MRVDPEPPPVPHPHGKVIVVCPGEPSGSAFDPPDSIQIDPEPHPHPESSPSPPLPVPTKPEAFQAPDSIRPARNPP